MNQSVETEEFELFQVECRLCGGPLMIMLPPEGHEYRGLMERLACRTATHDACAKSQIARQKAEKIITHQKAQLETWQGICPEEFRKTLDTSKRGYNQARYGMVMAWQFGEIGLRLIGPSGKCKTRFCYQLLGRELRAGRTVAGIMHGEFRSKISALAFSSSQHAFDFTQTLIKVDLLLIDDLGKGRATPAAEEAFYALVDGRNRKCRPTLYTMNTDLETFLGTCSEEYRQPLLRRIEDRTKLIEF